MVHRLTAILIADVVGYSRMLTSDEAVNRPGFTGE